LREKHLAFHAVAQCANAAALWYTQLIEQRQSKILVGIGMEANGESQQFASAEAVIQSCFAWRVSDLTAGSERVRDGVYIPDSDCAAVWMHGTNDTLEQRCLSCAVWADKSDNLALADVQRYAPEYLHLTKGLLKCANGQHQAGSVAWAVAYNRVECPHSY